MFCTQGTRSVRSHLDFLVRFGLTALFLALFGAIGCQRIESPNEEIVERSDKPIPAAQESSSQPKLPALAMKKDLPTRTVVLTYHDMVLKRDKDSVWFDCTPEELTEQLDYLTAQGADFISLEDLYKGLTGISPMKPKSLVITFADNYQGFYDLAWPILKARKIPVTLFVHTGHVGSQKGRPKMPWQTLKELAASGLVSVQSQTVSHPADLTKLPAEVLAKEFADSKAAIEKELGIDCWAIAYPNGKFNFSAAQTAQKAGYLIGFTEEQKPAETAPDIHRVPRWVHTKWKEAWNSGS